MTTRPLDPVGAWFSANGRMRVRLDPDGSFEELRIDTGRTYRGRIASTERGFAFATRIPGTKVPVSFVMTA
jgi:hypothetical protein